MSKKMTTTIAKALASKVMNNLSIAFNQAVNAEKKSVENSKEWKEVLKLKQNIIKLEKEFEDKKQAFFDSLTNKDFSYSYKSYSNKHNTPEVSVRYNNQGSNITYDSLINDIIIEDYTSNGGESGEELVTRITKTILSSHGIKTTK